MVWLEDQHVRFYPLDGRDALRALTAEGWTDGPWAKYLSDLECDVQVHKTRKAQLAWLTGRAVKAEYYRRRESKIQDCANPLVNQQASLSF